ncbi:Uncharacterized protein Fot_22388 [Forsythia ovata]|uniref:Uncharacterized protein n=1 Tax=Forsythia ovata TaxID=205694 RepID=A0ABD1UXL1_9LAMI
MMHHVKQNNRAVNKSPPRATRAAHALHKEEAHFIGKPMTLAFHIIKSSSFGPSAARVLGPKDAARIRQNIKFNYSNSLEDGIFECSDRYRHSDSHPTTNAVLSPCLDVHPICIARSRMFVDNEFID